MKTIQNKIKTFCSENLEISLENLPELHLSLSRTVVLRHHWIDNMVHQVREIFNNFPAFQLNLKPTIQIYSNDEETRTFLSISTEDYNGNILLDAVKRIDSCFEEYKLEKYYDPASFHVSLSWTLFSDEKRRKLEDNIQKINEICERVHLASSEEFQEQIQQIFCKSGNKVFKINLR